MVTFLKFDRHRRHRQAKAARENMQRPKRKENEDDLLRFQEQFLRQGADPSAKVQRVSRDVTESTRDIVKLDETGSEYSFAFAGPRLPRAFCSFESACTKDFHGFWWIFKKNRLKRK